MRRLRQLLWGMALAMGLSALALRWFPVPTGANPADFSLRLPQLPAGGSEVAAATERAPIDSLAEEIVLANVFARSRQPPAARFTPSESGSDSVTSQGGSALTESASAAAPVLYGTIVGAGRALALLWLDSSQPAPALYAIGDRAAGYRVLAIAPGEVVLAGPGGRLVLRLPPEEDRR